jgi:hypothetical protein
MDCQGNLISSGGTVYTGTPPITVAGSVIGANVASGAQSGVLSSTDWTTFNNKAGGYTASTPLVLTGSNFTVNTASTSQSGALSSTDWNTFNGKGPVYTGTAPVVVTGSVLSASTATTGSLGVVKVTNGNGLALAGDGTISKGTLQSYATGSGGITLSGNTISGAGVGNAAAYGFVAGLSANLTGQNNTTPATIVFNTTSGVNGISNPQYSTSTGLFTPNLAGYYSVKANINVTNNASTAYMYTASIMRNSTIMYTTNFTTASNNGGVYDLVLFGTVSMNGSTDELSVKINVNNAAHTYTINNGVSTSFEAFGYYANLTSAATSSANGYLTSTDWTTFNNKVSPNTTYDALILNTNTALKTTTINGSTIDVGSNSENTTLNLGTSGSTSTINIGTGAGTTTINLGGSADTVNVAGTLTTVNTTNLDVADKLVRLNKGGAAATATTSGVEIEENGVVTAYVYTSGDRNSMLIKAPNTNGVVTITPGASGFTLNSGSTTPFTTAYGMYTSNSYNSTNKWLIFTAASTLTPSNMTLGNSYTGSIANTGVRIDSAGVFNITCSGYVQGQGTLVNFYIMKNNVIQGTTSLHSTNANYNMSQSITAVVNCSVNDVIMVLWDVNFSPGTQNYTLSLVKIA